VIKSHLVFYQPLIIKLVLFTALAEASPTNVSHDCFLMSKVAFSVAGARDRGVSLDGLKVGFKALYESGDATLADYMSSSMAADLVYSKFTNLSPELVKKEFLHKCMQSNQ